MKTAELPLQNSASKVIEDRPKQNEKSRTVKHQEQETLTLIMIKAEKEMEFETLLKATKQNWNIVMLGKIWTKVNWQLN